MRTWLLLLALAACKKSSPASEPAPTDHDVELSTLAADMVAYTKQLPTILQAFDGDCAAHATRLLTLEPQAQSIRGRAVALSPEDNKSVRARMAARKAEILAEIDADLAAKHLTRADIEAKEAAVKAACDTDPKVKDAMTRVGLFKK